MGKQHNTAPAYNGNRPYIFISYAHKDASKILPLIVSMQDQGFRVWYDREIEGGNEWSNYVKNHLKNCSVFIAFASHNSVASEEWLYEIEYAKRHNKQSVLVFLGKEFKLPKAVELQTSRFHRMSYMEHSGSAAFVAQLREADKLSICLGEEVGEYYNELKKNDALLYKNLKNMASRTHHVLEHIQKFVVTPENDELFRQAELLYAGWLFNRDGKTTFDVVDKAVELCRLSAEQGNPKALARLAYFYDNDYIAVGSDERDGDELMHFKIAYSYYTMLCYAGIGGVEAKEGCAPVQWEKLRQSTARAMLRMLHRAPEALQENHTYNFKMNLDRVQSELGLTDIAF